MALNLRGLRLLAVVGLVLIGACGGGGDDDGSAGDSKARGGRLTAPIDDMCSLLPQDEVETILDAEVGSPLVVDDDAEPGCRYLYTKRSAIGYAASVYYPASDSRRKFDMLARTDDNVSSCSIDGRDAFCAPRSTASQATVWMPLGDGSFLRVNGSGILDNAKKLAELVRSNL